MEFCKMERKGIPFFFCDSMWEEGAIHGFSTRLGGVSPAPWDSLNLGLNCGDDPERVTENLSLFCGALGISSDHVVRIHQVHGDVIHKVERRSLHWADTPQGDGLMTQEAKLGLEIRSADCIPILLFDPCQRVIAALHAGWRGTALGIAAKGVQQMVAQYGCHPKDMMAAIGPGIQACCFQTHGDVPKALMDGLGGDASPWIRSAPKGEMYHVDLQGANRTWLTRSGLDEKRIAESSLCTACHPELFWSHRRCGLARGSMASIIQMMDP